MNKYVENVVNLLLTLGLLGALALVVAVIGTDTSVEDIGIWTIGAFYGVFTVLPTAVVIWSSYRTRRAKRREFEAWNEYASSNFRRKE